MRLVSSSSPVYLPEEDQSSVLRLGLNPLSPEYWLQTEDDFQLFQQHKLEQGNVRPDSVYGEMPGSEEAVAELTGLICQHLLQVHRESYSRLNDTLQHRPSGLEWQLPADNLWQASLWVPEDLCVLQEINGEFVMTAASVCSPSNWHPADKLGRSLDVIHGPVPGYPQVLSRRVNSLFRALKPHKLLLRYNWSLQRGNELYWRDRLAPVDHSLPHYWRVERQTLRRLPVTGAIVFTIRIYLHERSQLEADSVIRERLSALLERLPEAERNYKGLNAGLGSQ